VRLYRVIPYDASAAPTQRGGVLFVPAGGSNRIDNPDLYDVLYLAGTPEAAMAETFGRIPLWTPETFVHGSGRRYALTTIEAPDSIALFALDDVDALKSIGITKPRSVVMRDRGKTQALARAIFETGRYAGASWWSYYGPDLTVMGRWDRDGVSAIETPENLTVVSAVVKAASDAIVRQIVRTKSAAPAANQTRCGTLGRCVAPTPPRFEMPKR